MKAVRVHAYGAADVQRHEDVELPVPGAGEALVQVAAAGLNFIDVSYRTGVFKAPQLPFTNGSEAAGTVTAIGPDVSNVKVGERVAFCMVLGAYAEYAIVPAWRLVTLPASIDFDTAAAVMLQGMTAHYLARSTFALQEGHVCVIHAVAGGVGLMLCQIAKLQGATVIGTTSTEKKAELARTAGADHVILYTQENVADRVRELTDGRGADVVYDSVGQSTIQGSLDALRRRGMLVSFGQSSGPVPPIDPLTLSSKGSLFLTRPILGHYTADREELEQRAEDIFTWMQAGKLKVRIDTEYTLEHAADAHAALESRKTSGKVLIVP